MFYSQFILAKKGPLGTIWIAAHLERKLRKNQVADTDIGISVDSILFPEVPIALRLSSHLLLGVVRIYSRKVNYLFDDCSEALLKIKQAFRSTAVDLPPEESTAPYHSITLPETFDLDDFELPDNDIFQGNYVDHHISSREQITLQDTMEGVVYSTSQFGLDERFGDGDTSGLDLDEEMLMEKVAAEAHTSVILTEDADPRASVQPVTTLTKDEDQDTMAVYTETIVATDGVNQYNDQIEEFDGDADHVEYAQAPCTPGLWEEPNLSNVQETSACDDHLESENHNLTDSAVRENLENASSSLDLCNGHKTMGEMNLDPMVSLSAMENEYLPGDSKLNQLQLLGKSSPTAVIPPVTELSDKIISETTGLNQVGDIQDISSKERGIYPVSETREDGVESQGNGMSESSVQALSLSTSTRPLAEATQVNVHASFDAELTCNEEIAKTMETTCPLNNGLESNPESDNVGFHDEQESPCCQERQDSKSSNGLVLRPCKTHLIQHDTLTPGGGNSLDPQITSEDIGLCSSGNLVGEVPPHASEAPMLVQGEGSHATDGSQLTLEETHIHTSSSKSNDQVNNIISGDSQVQNISSSTSYDLPAPEKLLSVPKEAADVPSNLFPETTPDRIVLAGDDGNDAGSITLTGKKRSYAESALTVQSMNTVESTGILSTKMTAESVPDDDDLLSSILVGRKSSVLRVKSTPPLEMASIKRRRSAARTGASKRKVLMDDTMVLHGDTIRQQLTNTEDIRRVRKKAPCTRPEISMIQKQFWEDELFTEAIFTGVSMDLASLHNQAYDLTVIRIVQADASLGSATNISLNVENGMLLEASNSKDASSVSNVNEFGKEPSCEPADARDTISAQPVVSSVLHDNQLGENNAIVPVFCGNQVESHPIIDAAELRSSELENLEETSRKLEGKAHTDVDTVPGEVESSMHPDGLAVSDAVDMPACTVQLVSSDKTGEGDASVQMNELGLLQDHIVEMLSTKMDASMGGDIDKVVETNVTVEEKDVIAASQAELSFDNNVGGASVELTRDNETGGLDITQSAIPSAMFSPEIGGGSTEISIADQAMDEIREYERKLTDDPFLDAEVEFHAKNLVSEGVCRDELVIDPLYSTEVGVHLESVFADDGENLSQQVAYPRATPNGEVATAEWDDRFDLDYSAVGHDTEFLNVDDDDDDAEADADGIPNAEELRIIDNSGWSTRTRAVAKYLQTLFDKEADRERKVLPIDNLLAGKTRKEASRMFFETLVLKTKDFIHVEQRNSFDNINLLPRAKLMKSDFS